MLKPFHIAGVVEAGCDEAGRGCLAGPVFAAAVILPADFSDPLLNDSKQLVRRVRELLRQRIEAEAVAFGIGIVDEKEIDRINILNASFQAMHLALEKLEKTPEKLLVDGNRFRPYKGLPYHCIIRGDGTYASIAAASILAKTHRDQYMETLHQAYPMYGWDRNKGYPTREHRLAIRRFGLTDHHRRTFRISDGQMLLDL